MQRRRKWKAEHNILANQGKYLNRRYGVRTRSAAEISTSEKSSSEDTNYKKSNCLSPQLISTTDMVREK